jgi:hypothetical protein
VIDLFPVPYFLLPKLVIFTEHRDTLNYLVNQITTLIGRPEAVVTIHGGMGREERKKAEEAFKQDVTVQVLIATDAAGEGINLQRAHLMVNYDLPWNPNRLEQRFGRIHRIGQTEVCHLWNLVAEETREGDVYLSLLKKLEIEQKALGGKVFDVLGKAIAGKELRELLIEAIRYGDRPDVKAKLDQVVGDRLDQICFEKELISVPGKPLADFVCPSHPLLDATIDLTLERHRDLLRQGAILVDENDPGEEVRALVYLEHSIQDARTERDGRRRVVSRRMQYVEIFDPQDRPHPLTPSPIEGEGEQDNFSPLSPSGRGTGGEGVRVRNAGYAPYLDYRPLEEAEKPLVETVLSSLGLRDDIESKATSYAIAHLVSNHLQEVRERKEELIEKTVRAVKDRLTKEINYWDQRAADLRLQEQAGKPNAKLNSAKAQQRADELAARLQKRLSELEQERKFSPMPPIVVGGALVVPIGLLQRLQGKREAATSTFARETKRVELAAMAAVMAAERALGYEPRDVRDRKCGYDIRHLRKIIKLW